MVRAPVTMLSRKSDLEVVGTQGSSIKFSTQPCYLIDMVFTTGSFGRNGDACLPKATLLPA